MSPQAPSRSAPPRPRRRLAAGLLAAALAAIALALSACGGGDGEATAGERAGQAQAGAATANGDITKGGVIDISGSDAVGESLAGSVAPLVTCRDWNGANHEQKLATIEDVRSQINLEDSGISAPALTDEEALQIFDNSCAPAYAAGFRLYKLYSHAAGFAPLARELSD